MLTCSLDYLGLGAIGQMIPDLATCHKDCKIGLHLPP